MPKFAYFRFGLRTVFVLLTAFCLLFGYVGYEYSWVRQRRAFLENEDLSCSVGFFAGGADFQIFTFPPSSDGYKGEPLLLSLFSLTREEGVGVIVDEKDVDWHKSPHGFVKRNHPRLRRAQELFPEAILVPFCKRGAGDVKLVFPED